MTSFVRATVNTIIHFRTTPDWHGPAALQKYSWIIPSSPPGRMAICKTGASFLTHLPAPTDLQKHYGLEMSDCTDLWEPHATFWCTAAKLQGQRLQIFLSRGLQPAVFKWTPLLNFSRVSFWPSHINSYLYQHPGNKRHFHFLSLFLARKASVSNSSCT